MSDALLDHAASPDASTPTTSEPPRRAEPSLRAHVVRLLERERDALVAAIRQAEHAHAATP